MEKKTQELAEEHFNIACWAAHRFHQRYPWTDFSAVLSDAMWILCQMAGTYRPGKRSFSSYYFQYVFLNLKARQLGGTSNWSLNAYLEKGFDIPDPRDAYAQADDRMLCENLIQELRDRDREILVKCVLENKNCGSVAAEYGLTRNYIYQLKCHAIQRARKTIGGNTGETDLRTDQDHQDLLRVPNRDT